MRFMLVARNSNFHIQLSISIMDQNGLVDEKCESRLYIGNLDHRITEALLIKLFSPFGKIVSEDFLWHTRGPKRGEPRGFAFIQYNTRECLTSATEVSMQEAQLAKEKMNGRFACGRPLVVRLAGEKFLEVAPVHHPKAVGEANKSGLPGSLSGQMSRSAKIAAIKNKLKAMEDENCSIKKQRPPDNAACGGSLDHSSVKR